MRYATRVAELSHSLYASKAYLKQRPFKKNDLREHLRANHVANNNVTAEELTVGVGPDHGRRARSPLPSRVSSSASYE